MKTRLVLLLAASALILPSCAAILQAAWTPPTRDAARLQAGTYMVEPLHTQVLFSVLHFGLTNYYGHFYDVSGSLAFTPNDPAKMALSVIVPVASVATTSTKLDGELKGPDWLDAARYPKMTFASSAVTLTGPHAADVSGTLTLHGVSRPLTLHATFNGGGINPLVHREQLGFQASGTLKRSDFGVSKGLPLINDEIEITIAAAFQK